MLSAQQANVEYFFRLLYDLFGKHGQVDFASFEALLVRIWNDVVIIGYVLAVAAFFFIIYILVKLFELRHHEEEHYSTVLVTPESEMRNARWEHILRLMESDNASEWREAILEADIMLDDMLARQGYAGDGVGEKLQMVEPSDFDTLQKAWDAHKVRNQVAHQGSAFDLNETLARRTIANYEAVFKEFDLI